MRISIIFFRGFHVYVKRVWVKEEMMGFLSLSLSLLYLSFLKY
jgi:hypothetical protein